MLTVVIADDDIAIRHITKKVIEKNDNFTLVGEAEQGQELLALVRDLKPDVVFLDIEMPILDGVSCAKHIFDQNPWTHIIFQTAYSDFMKEAFEVYAFDYIVKPFKIERLEKTLERLVEKTNQRSQKSNIQTEKNLISLDKKLMISGKEGMSFINPKNIIMVLRENHNTVIHTAKEDYITSESLAEMEEKLDSQTFLRSHKSYIININAIHKIFPYGRWTFLVQFEHTKKDALITKEKLEYLKNLSM